MKNGAEYYQKNKERIKEQARQHYAENQEKYREYSKQYRLEHKDHISAYMSEYVKRNGESRREQHKKWITENPVMQQIYNQQRRARQAGLSCDLTPEEWSATLQYFNNECAYCGTTEGIQQDHFITHSKGGHYVFGNIVPCCRSCNAKKHTSDFYDWYPGYKHYLQEREIRIITFINEVKQ